ncbi:MAG: hypothetical protein D6786_01240 [Gammaproteobacteria bacterium]|nr:MAG: hypothetical protein D6786_01240 [Gammaproteobacteria bacterium]
METLPVTELLLLVATATLMVALLVHFHLSPILAYLVTGMLLGPQGLALLPPGEAAHWVGELGVAFLMFIVGLEFSLPRMMESRRVVFGMGSLEVVTVTLPVAALLWWLGGLEPAAAIIAGGALAMSSTAIAAKQLADQGELSTAHGHLSLGILLFQDLATLPFLLLIGTASAGAGLTTALVGVLIFITLAFLLRRPLESLMYRVARTRSQELFLLTALLLVTGAGAAAHAAGLSLALGAFFAGMVVGESDYRHLLEEEVRPFRDLLLGFFFVTIGMQVDLHQMAEWPLRTLLLALTFILLKGGLVFAIARIGGWPAASALRTALVLAHGGEFSLLLVTQALQAGLLPPGVAQALLLSLTLSIALAPLLIQHNGSLAGRLEQLAGAGRRDGAYSQEQRRELHIREEARGLENHVLLCGCGRVGRLVAGLLEAESLPYIALDNDPDVVREARRRGYKVLLGDATRSGTLQAAGVNRAAVVVSTLPAGQAVLRLIRLVRGLEGVCPPIVVSIRDEKDLPALLEAGATTVLPESFSAGLELAAETLRKLGREAGEVDELVEAARIRLRETASPG